MSSGQVRLPSTQDISWRHREAPDGGVAALEVDVAGEQLDLHSEGTREGLHFEAEIAVHKKKKFYATPRRGRSAHTTLVRAQTQ